MKKSIYSILNYSMVIGSILMTLNTLLKGHIIAGLIDGFITVFLYYFAIRNDQCIKQHGEMLKFVGDNQTKLLVAISGLQTVSCGYFIYHGGFTIENVSALVACFSFTACMLIALKKWQTTL